MLSVRNRKYLVAVVRTTNPGSVRTRGARLLHIACSPGRYCFAHQRRLVRYGDALGTRPQPREQHRTRACYHKRGCRCDPYVKEATTQRELVTDRTSSASTDATPRCGATRSEAQRRRRCCAWRPSRPCATLVTAWRHAGAANKPPAMVDRPGLAPVHIQGVHGRFRNGCIRLTGVPSGD